MKSLFVVLLAVVVAEGRQVCVPGTTFKQSCNTCHCSSNGLTAACTLMGCPPMGNSFKIYPSHQSTTEQPSKDDDGKPDKKQVCVPGSTFKRSCNTCHCNSEGTAAACTLKGCPEDNPFRIYPTIQSNEDGASKVEKRSPSETEPEKKQVCVPGSTWKQSCNSCFCTSDGTAAACTLMGCPEDNPLINIGTEKPSNEDGASKVVKRSPSETEPEVRQVCIANTTWKMDCNTCFCNAEGTGMGCTLMLCPPKDLLFDPAIQLVTEKPSNENRPFELITEKPSNEESASKLAKRSPSETEPEAKQVCVPNSTFMQSCNSCFCNSDGTAAACTAKGCPEDGITIMLPTKKPSNEGGASKVMKRSYSTSQSVYGRRCEPGTIVKHYCNTCTCNKLGQVGRCTKMFCDEEMYNEDGTYRISPNSIFKN